MCCYNQGNNSKLQSIIPHHTKMSDVKKMDEIYVMKEGQKVDDVLHQIVSSETNQDAFYILDLDDIVQKHQHWMKKMPRVAPFYAVKANDNKIVLQTLASLGVSFECASKCEIKRVMEYTGEDPKKIVFSMPIRQESEISFAASLNVLASVFDNEDELYKIKKLDPRARLLIRFRCDAKKASVIFGRKFGAEPESVPRLLRVARSLDLDIVGLAFHVGSDCHEPDAFKRAILIGRQLMDLAAKEFGYNMTLLDIGGGFSGDQENLNCLAFVINSALEKHFPVNCGVNIIAEPGRYYVTSAFTLATRIFGRRLLSDEVETNQGMSCYYYINDGIFGNFMDRSLLGLTYKPRPILMKSANEVNSNIPETQDEVICTIYGMSGDSNDYVAHKAGGLPLMDIGDWLIFPNMGAYTLVFSTSFNGFEAPDFALGIILEDTWHQHFVPNGSTKQKFSIKLNRNSWSNLETLSLSPICKEAMAPKMIFQVNSSKQK